MHYYRITSRFLCDQYPFSTFSSTDWPVAQSAAAEAVTTPLLRKISRVRFKYPGSCPRQSDRVVIRAYGVGVWGGCVGCVCMRRESEGRVRGEELCWKGVGEEGSGQSCSMMHSLKLVL